jgi:calcium-dependent protein kinase
MIDAFVNSFLTAKYETLADALRDSHVKFHTPGSNIQKVYSIGRRIDLENRSTFAQVRIATHLRLQTRRAVKTYCFAEAYLDNDLLKVVEFPNLTIESVLNEIEAHARTDCPFIVECYEVFYDRGFIHIVNELCRGGDLHDLLKKEHRLTERQAASYFSQMMTAVMKMHEVGIAHRALCLENVLLSDEAGAKLKVISFGSSGAITAAGFTKKYGSPLYMAPEVFAGNYNETVDVWAVAVIIYTCLFGFQPFAASDLPSLIQVITNGNYSKPLRWKHLSEGMREILDILLRPTRPSASTICNLPIFKLIMEQDSRFTMRRPTRANIDISTEPESAVKLMAGSRLRVAVLNFLSQHKLVAERLGDLELLLAGVERSSEGQVSEAELTQALMEFYSRSGIRVDAEQKAKNIVSLLDVNTTGLVQISEVIYHMTKGASTDEALRTAFETYSLERNPEIELEELRSLFEQGDLEHLRMKFKPDAQPTTMVTFAEFAGFLQQ